MMKIYVSILHIYGVSSIFILWSYMSTVSFTSRLVSWLFVWLFGWFVGDASGNLVVFF